MTNHLQTIKTPAGEELVVIPRAEYDRLLAAALDVLDDEIDAREAAKMLERMERGEEQTFPHDVVMRLRRENRVKVLREHRGMTQEELAAKADLHPLYLSQIETGRATGGLKALSRLAQILGVSLDMIAPPPAPKKARVKMPRLKIRRNPATGAVRLVGGKKKAAVRLVRGKKKAQESGMTDKPKSYPGTRQPSKIGDPVNEEMHAPRLEPRKTREQLEAETVDRPVSRPTAS